jgi:hypothetical protein
LEIRISTDVDKRTITIVDSGIGMSKDELHVTLGTIARSGSKNFLKSLQEQVCLVVLYGCILCITISISLGISAAPFKALNLIMRNPLHQGMFYSSGAAALYVGG